MKNFFQKFTGLDNKKNESTENDDQNNISVSTNNDNSFPKDIQDDGGEWIEESFEEGQLSIDVYQTSKAIIIKSTIAGVKPEDIDISINNDMLTIRGKREHKDIVEEENYLYRECYWGSFSRSIILPIEVNAEKIEAVLENGVLTVSLPKAKTSKQISIKVREK
jgi:HSP20 family protein